MSGIKITDESVEKLGLTRDEYKRICRQLGREPNYTELGLFSAMWSEQCSHKNSKSVLKLFSTGQKPLIQQLGKDTAVVNIDEKSAVLMKIKSVDAGAERFADFFALGAKPVGLLFSLHLAGLENKKAQHLLKEINKEFFYCAKIPKKPLFGGEIYIDSSYQENPLVNVLAVGIVHRKHLLQRKGLKPDSSVYSLKSSPKLGQVCLELIEKGCLERMMDIGKTGVIYAGSQMAYKGGTGIEINLDLVPGKSSQMNPCEIISSQFHNKILLFTKKEKERSALNILKKRNFPSVKIGRLTDDGNLRIKHLGKIAGEVPVKALLDAPEYFPEMKTPAYLSETMNFDIRKLPQPKNYNHILLKLIPPRPKDWGGDEIGAFRLPQSRKAVAWTVNGNGTYCYLNSFRGGAIAVAEAARRLICSGAKPAAITNHLNVSSPLRPESFWQMRKSAEGITEACGHLNIPVVNARASLDKEKIDPTPIVGMVGVIDDWQKITTPWFKNKGDLIALIGENKEELGGSEYLKTIHSLKRGDGPAIDWDLEKKGQNFCLSAIRKGLINSAQACSKGGLAIALSECCLSNPKKNLGAKIEISNVSFRWAKRIPQMEFTMREPIRADALLFGESQSRIIVSFSPAAFLILQDLAQKLKVRIMPIGRVEETSLLISVDNRPVIDLSISRMKQYRKGTLLTKGKRKTADGKRKKRKEKNKPQRPRRKKQRKQKRIPTGKLERRKRNKRKK